MLYKNYLNIFAVNIAKLLLFGKIIYNIFKTTVFVNLLVR